METFYWTTEQPHQNNTDTMNQYLCEHLPLEFTIIYQDDSTAEIRNSETAERFQVHATGNGDSYNHKVEFKSLPY